MDSEVLQQVLDELFPTLEAMESQNAAILQFLKDRYILSDEDLAPFLEKAGNASNVRWIGTRLRVKHILEGAARAADVVQQKPPQPVETKIDQQTTQAPAKEPTTKSDDNQRSAAPNAADPQKEPEGAPDQQRNKGNQAEGVGKTDEPDKLKEPAKTNAA
jgi:hypothetical protein